MAKLEKSSASLLKSHWPTFNPLLTEIVQSKKSANLMKIEEQKKLSIGKGPIKPVKNRT